MTPGDPLARLAEPGLDVAAAGRVLRAAFAATDPQGAAHDARLILRHVLGLDLTALTLGADRPVDPEAALRLADLGRRRLAGEPVARLLGSAGFRGLDFALTPATLVPRPDTETLVEAVLARIPAGEPFVFADLGVGSGAVLVALLVERPAAFGLATDLSAEALATARANAEANGVADRAAFLRASYAAALAPGAFDVVVSNPPYIASAEIADLDLEVRLHDPRLALDGGADGLDAYRAIAPEALAALRPGGLVAVEIGWRQAAEVVVLLAASGFRDIVVLPDLAGRDRVVAARAPHQVVEHPADDRS